MYLYSTKLAVVVYHKHLVAFQNLCYRELPFKVAKHKSKLRRFYFNVVYQPESTTTDNRSCHPHLLHLYTAREGIQLHIEDKEKETKIIVN